jgi:hypothetical protein
MKPSARRTRLAIHRRRAVSRAPLSGALVFLGVTGGLGIGQLRSLYDVSERGRFGRYQGIRWGNRPVQLVDS